MRRFDRNGSQLSGIDPDTLEDIDFPDHDSDTGYGFFQDMDDELYIVPLLMCPKCGSYRNHNVNGSPYKFVCDLCGRRFEHWYPNAPNQPSSRSMRFNIVDKYTGKVLASDLTMSKAREWVERYNKTPQGQAESLTAANRFFKRSVSLPDVEYAANEIAVKESEFIDDNQRMPIMDVGESISFPERKWKLVRSKAKKTRGLLR